jgi:SAM-dependent methyltransferase
MARAEPDTDLRTLLAPADLAAAVRALGPEPRRCLVCDGASFERLFRRDGKWFWLCRACELVFVHDIYPEFALDTDHLDGSYVFDALEVAGPKKQRKFDEFLAPLACYRSAGRLLEIGCGQGLFLARARELGWSVQGVELLPPVAERARERGLAIFTGELGAAAFPDAHFDVVVLREVIEHIVDPRALLAEVKRVLRPGGAVSMGTGNAHSWAARLRGARWHYYRFGGHMHIRFYSPRTAASLARASGFARVEARTSGFAFLEAEEMRGRWFKPILKIAQAPLSPFARVGGRGQRLVMTFEKG